MVTSNKTQNKPKLAWRYLFMAITLVLSIILLSVLGAFYRFYTTPVLKSGATLTLTIPSGTSWPGTVSILEHHGLVKSPVFFELWARHKKLPPRVKAGVYSLKGPVPLAALEEYLSRGGSQQGVRVVIPEGFTIFHVGDRLEKLNIVSKKVFLKTAQDKVLLSRLDIPGDSVEGYIFPDTYFIERGTTAEQIIERMHDQFKKQWKVAIAKHPNALNDLDKVYKFDKHDVIIMASIVERETNHDGERDRVSRVFYNRLRKKMRLQTDPTCVYNAQRYDQVPTPKDCKDQLNRYSTYVIKGMPPGPISSPGLASIEAALSPSTLPSSRKWLFFVAKRDGSGSHHFSKTFGEHKKAIRKFLIPASSKRQAQPKR